MNSTIINKMLPTPSFWSFLFPSLALHGFLGLILLQAAFSPKPPWIEKVITIQIVDMPVNREEKRISPVSSGTEKIIPPCTSLPPLEKELFFPTTARLKEEQPGIPTEELSSPKQDFQEQLPLKGGEEKLGEIVGKPVESITPGRAIEDFSPAPGEKPGDGGLPTRKENRGSVAVVDFGLGGSVDKSPKKKQVGELGQGQGGKTGPPASLHVAEKGRDDLAAYLSAVRWKIDEVKKYPRKAIRKNWTGTVIIAFQINQEGKVRDIKLIQSSGHHILDEEGMAILRRASPLPRPPSWKKEKLELEIPILFSLDRKK